MTRLALLVRWRRSFAAGTAATVAATLATWAGPAAPALADTSPGPPVAGIACQYEQFPHAGSPRSAPYVPYEIPFTATLGPDPAPLGGTTALPTYPAVPQGGWLEIKGHSRLIPGATVSVTLGGPVVNGKGQVYARGCGVVQLPSEVGGIGPNGNAYQPTGTGGKVNPNFVFANATPVSIGVSLPGIPLNLTSPIVAYGSADGFLGSDIQLKPAANGGLNVDFYSTAKSTTNLSEVLSLFGSSAQGSDCTVTIGDLADAGLPVPPAGIDGLTYQQATTPVHLDTTASVPDPNTNQPLHGQPVTGPIAPSPSGHAQDTATLVANDFPVAAIDPNMPASPNFPGTATCSQTNADLLNNLIGLPNPAGQNYFYAPSTFGVYTSK